MIKRVTLILLALCAVLTSCSQDPENTSQTTTDTAVEDTDVQTQNIPTDSETEAATEPETEKPWEVPEFEYLTDISKYEKYIEPEDRDGYLVLVNYANKLDKDDTPDDLTDVKDTRDDGRATQQMRLYAAKALEAFLIEARAAGCENVSVTSAYRSYDRQAYLFRVYTENEMLKDPSLTKEEAEAIVHKDTALPGESEHQTGLACDMHNLSSAKPEFGDTFEGKWLAENAWKFGFVLRYPEDKTEITNIVYEAWHFRYVGRYHASQMAHLDMCLEEYTDYLNNN